LTRVLVAGGTGYLGGFVVREFKARGHFVRALARSPEKFERVQDSLDEIVRAEVTRGQTLEHVCDGIDVVFSSIGMTKQKDKLTFRDVDYQGNVNLLEVAQRAGVQKFIYVSVFNGPNLLHLAIVKAHEDFVDELKASGMNYAVLRPTGYFSDMGEFLRMAKKGRVYLIGRGSNRVNPIHGADLAVSCVDALDGERQEVEVGGPEVLTYREIAELAFQTLGKRVRISVVPVWLIKPTIAALKMLSRKQGELLAFFTTAMTSDVVAPAVGVHRLEDHFQSLVAAGAQRSSRSGIVAAYLENQPGDVIGERRPRESSNKQR
jgi:uncharacterized protein YbjT (DUF2867 family)